VINLDKEIEEHFKECYPREGCGVVAIVKGRPRWFPLTNCSEGLEDFSISPMEYAKLSSKYDIMSIVHSHPDAPCTPSDSDVVHCDALGIPFIIYSYPSMEMVELIPKRMVFELIGKEYEFGTNDCLSLAIEYYQEVLGIALPPRKEYKDDWWELGEDYITEEELKEWGFYPVENYQKNDILIFERQGINSHIGIALEGDTFLHHAINRLSCRENLYPFWAKCLVGVYRYET
jgi:proteasome lid subunit RPN8/RPN11